MFCRILYACTAHCVQPGQPDKGKRASSGQLAGEGVGHRASVAVTASSAQHDPARVRRRPSAPDGLPRRQPRHVCSSLRKDHSQTTAQGSSTAVGEGVGG